MLSTEIMLNIEAAKFWERVSPPNSNGCREWSGVRNQDGYGIVHPSKWIIIGGVDAKRDKSKSRKTVLAHRLAWCLSFGSIPDGMSVLHKCDNPSCCNKDHLFVGTHADNMRDMVRKGRHWMQRKKIAEHAGQDGDGYQSREIG